jgi:hypothetical protein
MPSRVCMAFLTATEDYLPGAVGEQAGGCGLSLNAGWGEHVTNRLPADRPWQVVFSCS